VLRNIAEFSNPTVIATADFVAVVDDEACAGCGDCLERCQFGALALPEDVCLVDEVRCVGCGLCATVCPTEALHLERRQQGQVSPPPSDFREWMNERAKVRGLPEVL
jgi:MinD superfamily P-loop ATPase